jgi:phage minor structural protein
MKPILMNPSETLTQMLASHSNGLGRLNAQRCVVTEERNGMYEAELTVFIDDEHFSSLSVGSVLKLMTNEGLQMFRVYQITKPINGVCTVYAHHITYDLAKAAVLPFSATGAVNTVNGLVSHMASTYEFTMTTDIVNALSVFTLTEPKYFRECLGGYQGSVLDVFGGEYEWDNTTVKLLAHRGSDNGVQIRYGKNLTDIQQETNIESMYDAVIGYATVDDITTTGTVQMITQVSSPKTMIVDFSDEFDDGETVTVEKLNTLALNYIQTHDMTAPRVSIDVSFVALASTDQYKDIAPLEHVKLCDTVHVLFEKLGVNATAKVIKTEYDSLNERLLSVEVGDAKSTMTSVIDSAVSEATETQTKAVNAVDGTVANLTNMILNSLGLFVSKVEKSGGGYQYYMHNRPELSDSQYQWTINAGGFAVSQDYGQTWSAGIDADGNAVFNSISANNVDAMSITGSEITGGLITGTEIDSGDMYWFKGTPNQGLMHEATWSWDSSNHTGVELLSGAWRLNTGNAYHIMYQDFIQFRVGNDIGKNTITIDDDSISMFQNINGSTLMLGETSSYLVFNNGGMVMVKSTGVTVRTRSYYGSSLQEQHELAWRQFTIEGYTAKVLVAV